MDEGLFLSRHPGGLFPLLAAGNGDADPLLGHGGPETRVRARSGPPPSPPLASRSGGSRSFRVGDLAAKVVSGHVRGRDRIARSALRQPPERLVAPVALLAYLAYDGKVIDADSVPASRQQVRNLTDALRHQPRSFVQSLMDALRPEAADDRRLDRDVWGPDPLARRVRGAATQNLATAVARRETVLDQSVTRREVASALGKTEQAVSGMLERQALFGLKTGREWRIPSWQLAPELPTGILPGLRELASAYLDGLVSLSAWIERSNTDLDGATPREALLRGAVDDVLAAARTE